MVEEVMIEFDEVYNPDHIENVQPTLWEIRDLAVFRFDIPITIASLKQKSLLGKLEEGLLNLEQPMNLYVKVDLNRECVALEHHYKNILPSNQNLVVNGLKLQQCKKYLQIQESCIDAGDFTALNIPPASPRCRKTDVKIEKTAMAASFSIFNGWFLHVHVQGSG
ncbi:hypothetical protein EZV62_005490 [Acer yangbiense]|uniref:Uncharacterized protein n=1 Tax=Acer yangbiense TaxID=1000413 RepID=A0A5C7IMZ2_9ROSI|nr:hypothetical protein EZV62_005490 [Acer yangbiense]